MNMTVSHKQQQVKELTVDTFNSFPYILTFFLDIVVHYLYKALLWSKEKK